MYKILHITGSLFYRPFRISDLLNELDSAIDVRDLEYIAHTNHGEISVVKIAAMDKYMDALNAYRAIAKPVPVTFDGGGTTIYHDVKLNLDFYVMTNDVGCFSEYSINHVETLKIGDITYRRDEESCGDCRFLRSGEEYNLEISVLQQPHPYAIVSE